MTGNSIRATNNERIALIRETAQGFAEPFRSFVWLVPDDATVKHLDLDDWALPDSYSPASTYPLVGDAAHAMTMCKSRDLHSSTHSTH